MRRFSIKKFNRLAFVFLALSLLMMSSPVFADDAALAGHIMKLAGRPGGLALCADSENEDLAIEMAKQSPMMVVALRENAVALRKTREKALEQKLLGLDMYAVESKLDALPMGSHTVDLFVMADLDDESMRKLNAKELLRVLTPVNGKACLGRAKSLGNGLSRESLEAWAKEEKLSDAKVVEDELGVWLVVPKPPLDGAVGWSQRYYNVTNNPLSEDSYFKRPAMTQWLAKPYNLTLRGCTELIAGGRLLIAAREPGVWKKNDERHDIFCMFNVYNGQMLWRRSLPEKYVTGMSTMILTPDILYMALGSHIAKMDPETGEVIGDIKFPDFEGQVKWMGLDEGRFYLLLGPSDWSEELPETKPPLPQAGIKEANEGLSDSGRTLLCYDLDKSTVVWAHEAPSKVTARMIAIRDGRLYYAAPESQLAALDKKSGDVVWQNTNPEDLKYLKEEQKMFDGIVGTIDRGITALPEALIIGNRGTNNLSGFDPNTGKRLWSEEQKGRSMGIMGRTQRWVGVNGEMWAVGGNIDPLTGERTKRKFPASGCGVINATANGLFANCGQSYDFTENKTLDALADIHKTPCDVGTFVGDGVMFSPGGPCTCAVPSRGQKGEMFSEGVDIKEVTPEARLTRDEKYMEVEDFTQATDADWVTHQRNVIRGGASTVDVASAQTKAEWILATPYAEQDLQERRYLAEYKMTQPVTVGGKIFVASTAGEVRCIDTASGKADWLAFTGGPILLAPTYDNNRVYVGSMDGYAYCYEAATGRELWRFRVAPQDRRILVYGYLSNTWPVMTGVMVHDGIAYCGAGLMSTDGSRFIALDAEDGSLVWERSDLAPDISLRNLGHVPCGTMTVKDGHVWFACANQAYTAFDLKTGEMMPLPDYMRSERKPQGSLGQDIGLFAGKYILYGGQRLLADHYERDGSYYKIARWSGHNWLPLGEGGKPLYPELCPAPESLVTPAFDDDLLVVVPEYRQDLQAWDTKASKAYLDNLQKENAEKEYPFYRAQRVSVDFKDRNKLTDCPMRRWQPEFEADVNTVVLSKNAVLASYRKKIDRTRFEDEWTLAAFDRQSGQILWELKIEDEPLINGMSIDREGRIICAMRNGKILRIGK